MQVSYRADGKPETDSLDVSASHGAGLTFAVAGSGRLSCDAETALDRSEPDWAGLLGADQLAVRDLLADSDGMAVAGTRVWCALECLRKAGATSQSLAVEKVYADRWVVLSAGDARIATWPTWVDDRPDPVVFAVLAGQKG
jgi:enediyne polyketide synthase